jgi:hypothetical protein
MKVVDLMAWSEALDVSYQEVPAILRLREGQVHGLRDDVIRIWGGLREAPDEELLLRLGVAGRVLSEVADELGSTAADAAREVG